MYMNINMHGASISIWTSGSTTPAMSFQAPAFSFQASGTPAFSFQASGAPAFTFPASAPPASEPPARAFSTSGTPANASSVSGTRPNAHPLVLLNYNYRALLRSEIPKELFMELFRTLSKPDSFSADLVARLVTAGMDRGLLDETMQKHQEVHRGLAVPTALAVSAAPGGRPPVASGLIRPAVLPDRERGTPRGPLVLTDGRAAAPASGRERIPGAGQPLPPSGGTPRGPLALTNGRAAAPASGRENIPGASQPLPPSGGTPRGPLTLTTERAAAPAAGRQRPCCPCQQASVCRQADPVRQRNGPVAASDRRGVQGNARAQANRVAVGGQRGRGCPYAAPEQPALIGRRQQAPTCCSCARGTWRS